MTVRSDGKIVLVGKAVLNSSQDVVAVRPNANSSLPQTTNARTSEYCKELDDMQRLYKDEEWSLARIGEKYGMTVEGVRYRLLKTGIPMRPRARRPRVINSASGNYIWSELLRLYVEKKIAIYKLIEMFGLPNATIRQFLERQGASLRGQGMPRKYPELSKLKIGECIRVPKPTSKGKWHGVFYEMAARAGIRVSLRADGATVAVIRVS